MHINSGLFTQVQTESAVDPGDALLFQYLSSRVPAGCRCIRGGLYWPFDDDGRCSYRFDGQTSAHSGLVDNGRLDFVLKRYDSDASRYTTGLQ